MKYKTGDFPYDEFYDWARNMSKNNIVIVSEYNMPNDFKCIWEKDYMCLLDSCKTNNDDNNKRTEKLWIIGD